RGVGTAREGFSGNERCDPGEHAADHFGQPHPHEVSSTRPARRETLILDPRGRSGILKRIPRRTLTTVSASNRRMIECMRSKTGGSDVRLRERDDDEYPAQLRAVPSAPDVVYVRGTLVPDDALAVAIVGARAATTYGLGVAADLAGALAARGVTVVSGL